MAYPTAPGDPGVQLTQYNLPAPAVVVSTQPAAITTTVVTTQPQGLRPWSTNFCDCFNDIKSTLCALCFSNFYYACVATRMGENCCVGCSGDDAGCVPGGHIAMRTRLRTQNNIQGDICEDCLIMHFCKPCAMCQIARELNALGYPDVC